MYELLLGARYLYRGTTGRALWIGVAVALAVTLAGGAMLLINGAASSIGVITFELGLIMTMVFALLAVFSAVTGVSVLGVTFGVAALTIIFAVTTGFQEQFRDKVLGVNAHVIVLKSQSTFSEYRDTMRIAKNVDPDVIAVEPFIFAEMLVTRGTGVPSGVAIKGVDPSLIGSVLDLGKHMESGTMASLAHVPGPGEFPPTIIGKELAHKLKAKVGDTVTVVVPLSNLDLDSWRAKSSAPRTRKFQVTGIFYSGFDEYDRRLMYTSLRDTQDLVGRGDEVMGVELKVKDVDRASEIAEKLKKALGGPPFQVQDWYELNHNLFKALNIQKLVLVVILTLIIGVAAFNTTSGLIMMVTDRTREIAILKSMGATSAGVARIFFVVGLGIGAAGTGAGVIIGLATCTVVNNFGFRLDPKVYLIDHLPISVQPLEVVLVAIVSMMISVVAAWVPSANAAALTPMEGLRYD